MSKVRNVELSKAQRATLKAQGIAAGTTMCSKDVKNAKTGKVHPKLCDPRKIERVANACGEAFAVRGVLTFDKANAILRAAFAGTPQTGDQSATGLTLRSSRRHAYAGALVKARARAVKALLAASVTTDVATDTTATDVAVGS